MTRDEARRLVRERRVLGFNEGDNLVEALEALGLLKLEDQKTVWHKDVIAAIHAYPGTQCVVPRNVINALSFAGLKVVRA
jgi:hypothetical protein